MHPAEQNLREKAEAFRLAFLEAREAGFSIAWPVRGHQIGDIAISGTAKVAPTVTTPDGSPVERDAHGAVIGQPLDLTDDERAALPKIGEATGVQMQGFTVPADGVEREVNLEPAKRRRPKL